MDRKTREEMESLKKPETKNVHFRLEKDIYEELEKVAKAQHVPMTWVFRSCVLGSLADYADKTVFLDQKDGDEVKDKTMQIYTIVSRMQTLSEYISNNVNQIAKSSNTALLELKNQNKDPKGMICDENEIRSLEHTRWSLANLASELEYLILGEELH